jgi:hypothetical protein
MNSAMWNSRAELLGALPGDEEWIMVPEEEGHPPPYDFFGLGQTGQPTLQPQNNFNVEQDENNQQDDHCEDFRPMDAGS